MGNFEVGDDAYDSETHIQGHLSETCVKKMDKWTQLIFDIDKEFNKLNKNYKNNNINLLDFLKNSKFKKTYGKKVQYIENGFCFYISRTPKSILHGWGRNEDHTIKENDSEDIINKESDTYISVYSYVLQFIQNINATIEKETQKYSVNALKDSLLK